MRKIAVLGCGWLGLPLAKSLTKQGFQVSGSTTSEDRLPLLQSAGILPFRIQLSEKNTVGDTNGFLENSEILIIDIPPGLRGKDPENFVGKMRSLVPFIEDSTVKKVLFISSTAVFADGNSVITEDTPPGPLTESGRQLLEAEKLLQNNQNFTTTVLRFAGLIGHDRHPVHFLAGKKDIENPEAPVNLIHQKDCIGIIEAILEKGRWGEIFHGVAPQHPTRRDYYTQKAIRLGLPLPEFDRSKPSLGKTISSEKIMAELGYRFQESIS